MRGWVYLVYAESREECPRLVGVFSTKENAKALGDRATVQTWVKPVYLDDVLDASGFDLSDVAVR